MACPFLYYAMIKFINNISGNSDIPYCYQPRFFFGELFGGLLGMGSTAMSNAANARENQKNRDFQHDEAELAYQRQRTLIQEQNEYNSYSNQKKLMQDAGYNPYNLVGGTAGTAVSSSSTNAPQAGSAPSHAMRGLDPATLSAFANIGLTTAEINKTNAEANLIDSQTQKTQTEAAVNRTIERLNKQYFDSNEKWLDFERSTGIKLQDAQTQKFDADRKFRQTVETSLAYDELFHMRPAQYSNTVADSWLKQTQSDLNRIMSHKAEFDMKAKLRELGLQAGLYAAMSFDYYASGRLKQTQNIGQGVLNQVYGVDLSDKVLNFEAKSLNRDLFIDTFAESLRSSMTGSKVQSQRDNKRLHGRFAPFFRAFDEFKGLIPFAGGGR